MRIYSFIWIFCVFLLTSLKAQYTLHHFTQQNGLPQNSITDLTWDEFNFLWITTEDGLVRYNGNQFTTFNQSNSPWIKNDRFKWVMHNASKQLMASDAEGNIYQINQHKPQNNWYSYQYRYINGYLPDTSVLAAILTNPSFINRGTSLVFHPNYNQNHVYVQQQHVIYTFHNHSIIDSLVLPPGNLGCFSIANRIYSYTLNKVFYIDVIGKKIQPVVLPFKFTIAENNRFYNQFGKPCVVLKQGDKLHILNSDKNPLSLELTKSAVLPEKMKGFLQKILYHPSLNIFAISTNLNGFYLLKPSLFRTQSTSKMQEQSEGIYAHIPWNDTSILTSFGEIVSENQWSNAVPFRFKALNKKALLKDKNGFIWMLRFDSVLISDRNWNNILSIPTGSKHSIGAFIEWNNTILLVTEQEIIEFNNQKITRKISLQKASQSKNGDIALLLEKDTLYIGLKNGIYKFDLRKMEMVKKYQCLNSRSISRIGNLIICTTYGNGLYALVNDTLHQLPVDKNSYLSKAHNAVLADTSSFILVATNNGFFTTYLREIENYINKKTPSIYYHYFDKDDGILNTEFNGGCNPSYTVLPNGNITFSNMQGIVFVHPLNLKVPSKTNLHYVNTVKLNGSVIEIKNDSIYIPSSFNSLSFSIGSVYWNNPANIQIAYQLNGSNQWNLLERHDESIVFTYLNPGLNTVTISIQTNFGEYQKLIIKVFRQPAIYEELWFKIMSTILGITLLILLAYWYNKRLVQYNIILESKVDARTQQLKEMNVSLEKSKQELQQSVNVKNKLISIISHDIVTPIKFISMVSKNYNKKQYTEPENEIIKEINHTSQRLFDNAQNILNWVRYQNNLIKVNTVNVSPFVIAEETKELLLDVAAMRKNTIENLVEMDDILLTDKTILSIIIQNIVSNAVKYTQHNTILIKSKWVHQQYVIEISDQGPGISSNNLYRIEAIKNKIKTSVFNESADGTGLGYVIIFELADLINAKIDVQSSTNGTIVSIQI